MKHFFLLAFISMFCTQVCAFPEQRFGNYYLVDYGYEGDSIKLKIDNFKLDNVYYDVGHHQFLDIPQYVIGITIEAMFDFKLDIETDEIVYIRSVLCFGENEYLQWILFSAFHSNTGHYFLEIPIECDLRFEIKIGEKTYTTTKIRILDYIEDQEVLDNVNSINTIHRENQYQNATYNLQGQKVSENYRGIVVKNGKKVVVK